MIQFRLMQYYIAFSKENYFFTYEMHIPKPIFPFSPDALVPIRQSHTHTQLRALRIWNGMQQNNLNVSTAHRNMNWPKWKTQAKEWWGKKKKWQAKENIRIIISNMRTRSPLQQTNIRKRTLGHTARDLARIFAVRIEACECARSRPYTQRELIWMSMSSDHRSTKCLECKHCM